MAKKTSTVKIGIFIFLGIVILVIGIFLVGDKDALFSSTFKVRAFFNDIQGLRSGATVRLSGIDVGSVESVKIVSDTTGRVEVIMSIREDVKQFIRTDTRASIETEGLVGNKVVVLQIGSSLTDRVREGGIIQSKEPIGFAQVIEETQGIMAYTKEMTKNMSEIVNKINRGEGTIGKILNDDELYYATTEITKSASVGLDSITKDLRSVVGIFKNLGLTIDGTMARVDDAVEIIDSLIANIRDGKGVLGALIAPGTTEDSAVTAIMTNLSKMTDEANLAAIKLNENMEALKHNWLFKGYFEERGYWDAEEYQKTIDEKTEILNERIEVLEAKIKELKSLEEGK